MDATGIATDMVKGIANAIIAAVIKQIKDVVELDQSLQLLNTDFSYSILTNNFKRNKEGCQNPSKYVWEG
jgi:hypothetical protein